MFKPNYPTDYRILKIMNVSTLLLVTSNGREHETDINNIKPASMLKFIENVWDSFLNSIKTNYQNHDYNLRPHS